MEDQQETVGEQTVALTGHQTQVRGILHPGVEAGLQSIRVLGYIDTREHGGVTDWYTD